MTTEGQGRAADPVGLGIPVMIDGPWAEPRIYPDMAGILDNPDAAYARLKEMGKGLFGKDGGGLGGLLGGLSGGGQGGSGAAGGGARRGLSDALGGKLGETLGNLIQQGLGQGGLGQGGLGQAPGQRPSQGRSIPAPTSPVPGLPPAPQSETIPQEVPDNPAMNDVLRQLFNR
jgi:AsmA protein